MSELFDKVSEIFCKDRFELEFKNAVKAQNFSISNKISDDVYELSNGSASFKVNIGSARAAYEKRHSEKALQHFLKRIEAECNAESRMVSFTNGQAFLRFIVMRESDITQQMISADFIGNLKKVMVYTPDDEIVRILHKNFIVKWAVPKEVMFSVADRNMAKLLAKAKVNQSEIFPGIKALEFVPAAADKLGAALMMCTDFRRVVSKYIGSRFLVIAPSCESTLVIENITRDMLGKLGKVIVSEYKGAANPLTSDVLLFTQDDILIAGTFPTDDAPDNTSVADLDPLEALV